MQTSLEHTTDTAMTAAELLAQTTKVDQAWNQQDPLKIAQDLNAIIQNMMHSGDDAWVSQSHHRQVVFLFVAVLYPFFKDSVRIERTFVPA